MIIDNSDWNQQRLEAMISSNAEESVYLDFKAAVALSNDKKKDICKDVSAFANSDGGVIIYGINEVDHKADSFSFLDGDAITKEWLEQVLKDGIHRRVDGIGIYPIRVDNDINKTIYVVEVPVSTLAPHMIKDNRYYKRFNFMSVPMEEYEVRHTFERRQNAKLDFADWIFELQDEQNVLSDEEVRFDISFNIKNIGNFAADYYKLVCVVTGAKGCEFLWSRDAYYQSTRLSDRTNTISTSISTPIFPEEEVKVLDMALAVPAKIVIDVVKEIQMKLILYTQNSKVEKVLEPGKHMHKKIGEAIKKLTKNLNK